MARSYTFAADIRRIVEKIKDKEHLVVKKLGFDIGTAIVLRSPVGDAKYWKKPPPAGYVGGRFRANWQYGEGQANLTVTEDVDAEGKGFITRLQAGMGEEPAGKVHFFTNSLPYARRIEDGWSHRQAPQGVVRLTAMEVQQYVDEAVKEVR